MPDIMVDPDLCTGCGACVALCTGHVYREIEGVARAECPADCWLCGHCVAVCPAGAIRHHDYPIEECPPLNPALLPSLDSLVAAFRERRSARLFRDRPVPRDVVRTLVDVGRWAPSAGNGQPVDWLAYDDPTRIADLSARAVEVLAGLARLLRESGASPERAEGLEWLAERQTLGEDPIFFRAPVVLVAHVPEGNRFGRDDAVYAAYNLMLAAQRLGLGACQIGYFHAAQEYGEALRQATGLPAGRRAEVTLVLGYPRFGFQRVLPRRRPELAWNAGEAR